LADALVQRGLAAFLLEGKGGRENEHKVLRRRGEREKRWDSFSAWGKKGRRRGGIKHPEGKARNLDKKREETSTLPSGREREG